MKAAIVLLALLTPFFAHAEIDETSCTSRDRATSLEVAYYFEGSYDQIAENTPVVAIVRYTKGTGKGGAKSVQMSGHINESAKGPYVELAADDGTKLFLSAPASKSPSELTINGKLLNLYCN